MYYTKANHKYVRYKKRKDKTSNRVSIKNYLPPIIFKLCFKEFIYLNFGRKHSAIWRQITRKFISIRFMVIFEFFTRCGFIREDSPVSLALSLRKCIIYCLYICFLDAPFVLYRMWWNYETLFGLYDPLYSANLKSAVTLKLLLGRYVMFSRLQLATCSDIVAYDLVKLQNRQRQTGNLTGKWNVGILNLIIYKAQLLTRKTIIRLTRNDFISSHERFYNQLFLHLANHYFI